MFSLLLFMLICMYSVESSILINKRKNEKAQKVRELMRQRIRKGKRRRK